MNPEEEAELRVRVKRLELILTRIVEQLTVRRDSVLMELGSIENALGMARTKEPRHKRK